MPFVVKPKPKIDISFVSRNDRPHNLPTHITYHGDLDVQLTLVYWDTLARRPVSKKLTMKKKFL